MSFLCTRIHFIWSTARREPMIRRGWQPRLHGYMRGILENLKCKTFVIGGIEDHIHIYCSLPSTTTIADIAGTVKCNSTDWVRQTIDSAFGWQDGYAAFTMSESADQDVINYILTQEEHHRRITFKDELLAFLDKFGVEYDPRYVFQ